MAQAGGLALVAPLGPSDATALDSSTFGVGQLILHALDSGATQIIIALGGSASTDGGAGALTALGARVLDEQGDPIPLGGRGLISAARFCLKDLDPRLAVTKLVLACDVDNPLCGADGAAATYGPQKGASPKSIAALDAGLRNWANLVASACLEDRSDSPGSGAAGGLAFGLSAMLGARISPGIDLLLSLVGFSEAVQGSSLVIVGEGSLDAQSLRGKGPIGVATLARRHGAMVVAVAGRSLISSQEAQAAGLSQVYTLSQFEPDESRSMMNASENLERAGAAIAADHLTHRVSGP